MTSNALVLLRIRSTTVVVVRACGDSELTLAGAMLSDQFRRENESSSEAQPEAFDTCDVGVWLGLAPPAHPLRRFAKARTWMAYMGDPAAWMQGIAGHLQETGVDFVLAERFPDEWPDRLSAEDMEWLLNRWLPLPTYWSSPRDRTTTQEAPPTWLVVYPEKEKQPGSLGADVGEFESPKVAPGLALIAAGLAAPFILRGPPCEWGGQLSVYDSRHDVGFVSASRDPVINDWLGGWCASRGRQYRWGGGAGSSARCARSGCDDYYGRLSVGRIRPFMTAWFRRTLKTEPAFSWHAGLSDLLAAGKLASGGTEVAPNDQIQVLRKAFAVSKAGSNPVALLVRNNPRLWFWSALVSDDQSAKGLALGLPSGAIAAACDEFVRAPWIPLKDELVRLLESNLPDVWARIDAALSESRYDQASADVRKTIAGSLFIGAADGLVLEETQEPLRRSAEWFLAAINRSRDFTPDARCMALPALVRAERYLEATQVWNEAARHRAPTRVASALMRTFMMWLPVVESSRSVPTEAVRWLVDRVDGANAGENSLRMNLAMCCACLRLYRWSEGLPLEPLVRAYREKQASATQVAAFALYCWIRNEIETGRDALRLIDRVWPQSEEERFPIVCAHALLQPEVALDMRARYAGPTERFLRRGAPSHTRCFFWSLALASWGDLERSRELRLRALREDPLARFRLDHWKRVGLEA